MKLLPILLGLTLAAASFSPAMADPKEDMTRLLAAITEVRNHQKEDLDSLTQTVSTMDAGAMDPETVELVNEFGSLLGKELDISDFVVAKLGGTAVLPNTADEVKASESE